MKQRIRMISAILTILLLSGAIVWYEGSQILIETGIWAVPLNTYSSLSECRFGTFVCRTTDGSGDVEQIRRLSGDVLYSGAGASIHPLSEGMFEVSSGTRDDYTYLGQISIRKDRFADLEWNYVFGENQVLLPETNNRYALYGYVNRQHLWAIEPQFSNASEFYEDKALVTKRDSTILYILDKQGNTEQAALQAENWDNISPIYEGFVRILETNQSGQEKWYFLNIVESTAITNGGRGFDEETDFHDGCAAVRVGDLWGYIDTTGEWIIEPQYERAGDFSDGCAYVVYTDEIGYLIDKNGKQVSKSFTSRKPDGWTVKFDVPYEWAGEHHDGLFVAEVSVTNEHLLNMSGKNMLPSGTGDVRYVNGVWAIRDGWKYTGVYLPECDKYIHAGGLLTDDLFSDKFIGDSLQVYEHMIVVERNGKRILYDKHTGKRLCKYDFIGEFHEGLAYVEQGTRGGYINYRGELVIALQDIQSDRFSNGVALAMTVTGEQGFLFNPLLYTTWSPDELERGRQLGLTVTDCKADLSYEDLWARLSELNDLIYDTYNKFGTHAMSNYIVDMKVLRSALETDGYPTTGVVDKQHLALALCELSRAYGEPVDGYILLYGDSDETLPECRDALAYCSSFALFDLEGENVSPWKTVSQKDITNYLVRYFEYILH